MPAHDTYITCYDYQKLKLVTINVVVFQCSPTVYRLKVYSEKYYKIILCIWDASDLTYAIVYHIIFSCILYIIFFFVPCIANFLGNKNGNI